ncbi:type IV secretion system DNA-binding domain-containing protein [Paraburkholderia sp. GAS32]|uniref:type IV secretion system DNA-binding domain-containing protein n=1 Tax=Paraburkholderia sp. GAS32 TaxID=3035129 RepID=UPI003D257F09
MDRTEKARVYAAVVILIGILSFIATVKFTFGFTPSTVVHTFLWVLTHFGSWPRFYIVPVITMILAAIAVGAFLEYITPAFAGARFGRFYRGSEVVKARELAGKTREFDWKKKRPKQQITIAGIPMPEEAQSTHVAVGGSTGVGKSTLVKEMMYCMLQYQHRFFAMDPNGAFYSTFGRPKRDVLLNPFDTRSEGWVFFNEIRNPEFDFETYSRSIVQQSASVDEEQWNGYGRLLLTEVSKKVYANRRQPTIDEVFDWCCIQPMEDLEEYVRGTPAQSLFTGNEKATASARFVLSNKLAPHLKMPRGTFSIRQWLADNKGGNMYVTWDENMRQTLIPLLSTFADATFTSLLGMGETDGPPIWTFLDELESYAYLPNLNDLLTKGRKHMRGGGVVTGWQAFSQLVEVYGENMAETLLGNHRTTIGMGVGRYGEKTAKKMSDAFGQHQVQRDKNGTSMQSGRLGMNRSFNTETITESVILPSEFMRLRNLHGYLAFPGDLPIAKFKTRPVKYQRSEKVPGIILRTGDQAGSMAAA